MALMQLLLFGGLLGLGAVLAVSMLQCLQAKGTAARQQHKMSMQLETHFRAMAGCSRSIAALQDNKVRHENPDTRQVQAAQQPLTSSSPLRPQLKDRKAVARLALSARASRPAALARPKPRLACASLWSSSVAGGEQQQHLVRSCLRLLTAYKLAASTADAV
jgi:hypothetical protein